MSIKESPRYQELVEALAILRDLAIPEGLQKVALEHLLGGRPEATTLKTLAASSKSVPEHSLRSFVSRLQLKGAVNEIPCLAYWAKTYEKRELLDEKAIIELYRRAGLRPPKNVHQSFRDLCSKKYNRLESAENSQVRLSRVGEDFVIHDVIGKSTQEGN